MNTVEKSFKLDIPSNFGHLLLRFIKVVVIAFIVLQVKEYVDAGMFDTAATLVDAGLVAAGILIIDLILMSLNKR
ncbi:MAG: hypothetical protein ACYDHA_09680 [Bellilinea sp.]